VFDVVLPRLNTQARIPVCGLVAAYNATALPPGPDRLGLLAGTLLRKRIRIRIRIRMQGFIVFDDYGPRWSEFASAMGDWVQQGLVKVREDIVFGLENAPEAFIGLLQGGNFGKPVIQLAHE
jgi:NADPH-dependent curcumin reductase